MRKDEIVQRVREGKFDDLLGQLFNGLPTAFANVGEISAQTPSTISETLPQEQIEVEIHKRFHYATLTSQSPAT